METLFVDRPRFMRGFSRFFFLSYKSAVGASCSIAAVVLGSNIYLLDYNMYSPRIFQNLSCPQ